MLACVYGCQHPLWGGSETCFAREDTTDHDYECSCDDGFRSTDSFGSPSCVSKRALVAVLVSVALCGTAALGFFLLTALKQRRLPTAALASRRAVLRMRFIASASVYCGSASIVFFAAAAHSTMCGSGMLQTLYTLSMPVIAMAVAHMIDLWIDSLPKQLMPADGITIKVIKIMEHLNICMWVAWLALITLAPFGLMTFFVLDIVKVVRAINLVTAISAILGLLCFIFVGIHLTGIINKARRKANPSARVFYGHALRTLWLQVAALSSAATLWIAMALALEPQLGTIGVRTPIIPISIMVMDGFVGSTLILYFARLKPVSGAASPTSAASPRATQVNISAPVPGGVTWQMLNVAARLKRIVFDYKAFRNDSSLATQAGQRVVPTSGAC